MAQTSVLMVAHLAETQIPATLLCFDVLEEGLVEVVEVEAAEKADVKQTEVRRTAVDSIGERQTGEQQSRRHDPPPVYVEWVCSRASFLSQK